MPVDCKNSPAKATAQPSTVMPDSIRHPETNTSHLHRYYPATVTTFFSKITQVHKPTRQHSPDCGLRRNDKQLDHAAASLFVLRNISTFNPEESPFSMPITKATEFSRVSAA